MIVHPLIYCINIYIPEICYSFSPYLFMIYFAYYMTQHNSIRDRIPVDIKVMSLRVFAQTTTFSYFYKVVEMEPGCNGRMRSSLFGTVAVMIRVGYLDRIMKIPR